jgi:hypothetical protein
VLINNDYVQSIVDPCLYYRNNNYLLVYVDDILLFGPTISDIKTTKDILINNFNMKDLGELQYFLGIEIVRD